MQYLKIYEQERSKRQKMVNTLARNNGTGFVYIVKNRQVDNAYQIGYCKSLNMRINQKFIYTSDFNIRFDFVYGFKSNDYLRLYDDITDELSTCKQLSERWLIIPEDTILSLVEKHNGFPITGNTAAQSSG